MANLASIEIKHEGLGHLLADNRLRVPIYQRAYAWKKSHVKELFDDISRVIDDTGEDYFLGSVVACATSSESIEIVDGQQRLATTAILLAAIRDHLLRLGEKEPALDIEREYLLRKRGISKRREEPTLTLGEVDHLFFMKRVISMPDSAERRSAAPIRESHRRIAEATAYAAEFVRSIVGVRPPADQMTVLDTWVDYLRNRARVIFIKVPDHADAFVIFETLNDRGLELTISDLTKNYIFGRASERINEVRHNWNRMVGTLDAVSDQDITKYYIHQLWSSLHGVTKDREVFAKIRNKIKTEKSVVEFSTELAENALMFAALNNSDHEYWNQFGANARQHIRILSSGLRVTQIRMLLLAVLAKFPVTEVKRVLPYAVCWSVRFLIAGGSPGNLEVYYASRANRVRRGEIKTAKELIESMADVVPSDEKFEASFSTETVSAGYLARYYLQCLNKVRTRGKNPHLATDDEDEGSLEHILPRSPDRTVWDVDEVKLERLTKRIGNLTLLSSPDNCNRGNKSFTEAKKMYAKSPFVITQDLAKYAEWNEPQIEERQRELATLAVKAWPLVIG